MLAFFGGIPITFMVHQSLPQSLVSMINYTIATKSDCTYCAAGNELSCRTLGVDPDTLDKLINDLSNVNPERVRVIIDFSWKVAKHAQELTLEDFDRVREQGVTDGEILEIIMIVGLSVFSDIVADALQVDVDNMVSAALEQMG
jgi:alkylhydroperoxidase family enzyme